MRFPGLAAALTGLAVLAGLVGSALPARAATPVLQEVRFFTGPEATRVVLDLSTGAPHRVELDSLQRTVTVTVAGAIPAPGLVAPAVADGVITGLAVEEAPDGVRLLVVLAHWSTPQIFGLEGETGTVPRVVIDVPRAGRAQREAAESERVKRLATSGDRVVVIDPGHGGEATGAVGRRRTREKDVVLAIAKYLAAELEKQPGVKVVLTRTGDYDVPLRDRYRIAERYEADAFVSIHANSARRRTGAGTEVYFLSLDSASDEASKALADIENAADKISAGPALRQDDDLVGILFDLRQTEVITQSSVLAEAILSEIESGRKLESRGVKQAPFAVLKSPVVPSVLVETAFINNPTEEKLLRDPAFQKEMAEQIARGLKSYLSRVPPVARSRSSANGIPSGSAAQIR